jgi:hypothetical protein
VKNCNQIEQISFIMPFGKGCCLIYFIPSFDIDLQPKKNGHDADVNSLIGQTDH